MHSNCKLVECVSRKIQCGGYLWSAIVQKIVQNGQKSLQEYFNNFNNCLVKPDKY